MAQIKINGKIEDIKENTTLEEFLSTRELPKVFVVELNKNIANKNDYSTIVLKDGDVLEIATFCSGG